MGNTLTDVKENYNEVTVKKFREFVEEMSKLMLDAPTIPNERFTLLYSNEALDLWCTAGSKRTFMDMFTLFVTDLSELSKWATEVKKEAKERGIV